ncbi:hypothetical protein LINGRAHAP2_LOCUS10627 [Linum grandiflorum]
MLESRTKLSCGSWSEDESYNWTTKRRKIQRCIREIKKSARSIKITGNDH